MFSQAILAPFLLFFSTCSTSQGVTTSGRSARTLSTFLAFSQSFSLDFDERNKRSVVTIPGLIDPMIIGVSLNSFAAAEVKYLSARFVEP